MTETLHTPAAVRARCEAWRAAGRRVGLVPTMGALHAGHLSLVDAVRRQGAQVVVVSIFVNPLQFGEGEDLDRYPRTLRADLAQLEDRKVELAFVPGAGEMYPPGFQTHVAVEQVSCPLEGAQRPGHFQGVTTVVAKLLNIVGPCIAAFGRKDYQQWRVLSTMVRDLEMPIELIGCPVVREADGLAMSSRNRYLSSSERSRALAIYTGLREARERFAAGERGAQTLVTTARAPIAAAFDEIDYVAIADPDSLSPLSGKVGSRASLLAAARIGQTRLIDNTVLGEDDFVDVPRT